MYKFPHDGSAPFPLPGLHPSILCVFTAQDLIHISRDHGFSIVDQYPHIHKEYVLLYIMYFVYVQ